MEANGSRGLKEPTEEACPYMLGTGWRASVADATGKNRDCAGVVGKGDGGSRAFVNERESLERREKWVEAVRGVVEGALFCGACEGQ